MSRVFISFAGPDQDIVENLRGRLVDLGVEAWVYTVDRVLAKAMWEDIEAQLAAADFFVFAISGAFQQSEGQQRELQQVVARMEAAGGQQRILPIVLGDTPYSALPAELRWVNGLQMDAGNVRAAAQQIVERFFPELLGEQNRRPWNVPRPGAWLRVARLADRIEEHLAVNDSLCFYRVSPMGLFECYSPRLDSLFWILPDLVVDARLTQEEIQRLDELVPFQYSVRGRIEIEGFGWRQWHESR